MKSIVLLLCLMANLAVVSAADLLTSPHGSDQFIFKITADEARKLVESDFKLFDTTMLHTPVDTVGYNEVISENKLCTGNYIVVKVVENTLVCYPLYRCPFNVEIVSVKNGVMLFVTDSGGKRINNASIQVNNKTATYDSSIQAYFVKSNVFPNTVIVEFSGVLACYKLHLRTEMSRIIKPFMRIFTLFDYPIDFIKNECLAWFKFRNLNRKSKKNDRGNSNEFNGYLVFNKTQFSPGDTVKGKAFVVDFKTGKPIKTQSLDVQLNNPSITVTKAMKHLDGTYDFSFVLNDSLGLRLDNPIFVRICDGENVLISHSFFYSDYELKKVQLNVDVKPVFMNGEPVEIFCRTYSGNGMPRFDGTINLVAQMALLNESFFDDGCIRDTLCSIIEPVDKSGITKIVIPDSVFPKANISFNLNIEYVSADKNIADKKYLIQYVFKKEQFSSEYSTNGVLLSLLQNSTPKDTVMEVIAADREGGVLWKKKLKLPYQAQIEPGVSNYYTVSNGVQKEFVSDELFEPISLQTKLIEGKVSFELKNPFGLKFNFICSTSDKSIKGFELNFPESLSLKKDQMLNVSIFYLWKGGLQSLIKEVKNSSNELNILVNNLSDTIGVGGEQVVECQVLDYKGKPVEDVDITALSTAFSMMPLYLDLPKYEKLKEPISPNSNYWSKDVYQRIAMLNAANLDRYRNKLRVDSIDYFKFIYPKDGFFVQSVSKVAVTQVSPYIVDGGIIQKVHYVKINNELKYVGAANTSNPYSFTVMPGKLKIEVRTNNHLITITDYAVERGKRNILSLTFDCKKNNVTVQHIGALTPDEKKMLRSSLLVMDFFKKQSTAWLRHGDRLFDLFDNIKDSNLVVGPISYVKFILRRDIKTVYELKTDLNYKYQFEYDPFTVIRTFINEDFKSKLLDNVMKPTFYENAILPEEFNEIAIKRYDDIRSQRNEYEDSNAENSNTSVRFNSKGWSDSNRPIECILMPNNPKIKPVLFEFEDKWFYNIAPGRYRFFVLAENEIAFEKVVEFKDNCLNVLSVKNMTAISKTQLYSYTPNIVPNKLFWPRSYKTKLNQPVIPGNAKYIISGRVVDKTNASGACIISIFNQYGKEIYQLPVWNEFVLKSDVLPFLVSVKKDGLIAQQFYVKNDKDLLIILDEEHPTNALPVKQQRNFHFAHTEIVDDMVLYDEEGCDVLEDIYIPITRQSSLSPPPPPAPPMLLIDGEIEISEPSSLRTSFSDYAFWEPALRTDKDGKVSFKVKFPDDVTTWNATFIAMNGHKQSGMVQKQIRAVKPLLAELSVPRFLLAGDSASVIGRVTNYTGDTAHYTTTFASKGHTLRTQTNAVQPSLVEKQMVVASTDTFKVKYTASGNGGVFDGEEREIPVLPVGTVETEGRFYQLKNDTTITFTTPENGRIQLFAATSLLGALENEMEKLRLYPHLCNEQNASRLKAMLAQTVLCKARGQKPPYNSDIKKLIAELNRGGNDYNLWGWWANDEPVGWISAHVLEALLEARELGYKVVLNESQLSSSLVRLLPKMPQYDRIRMIGVLQQLDAKANYAGMVDTIQLRGNVTLNERLSLLRLRQQMELPVSTDSVTKHLVPTMFGNLMAEPDGCRSYMPWNSASRNTLLACTILKDAGHKAESERLLYGLFENNHGTGWDNTYEAADIITTLYPELSKTTVQNIKPTLRIVGNPAVITQFPYRIPLQPNTTYSISKSGDAPVWLTVYKRYFNAEPKELKGDFVVQTQFDQGTTTLTEGKETTLTATVTTTGHADYVMVSVPIPAGCSYLEKSQQGGVSHIEYFKDRVCIYIEHLKPGIHTYNISLMPRFSGGYTLNPARVELMYFPTFCGQTGLKRVGIE